MRQVWREQDQQAGRQVQLRMLPATPLVLADEPTGNLDSTTSEEIMDLFEELHRDGQTLILVTHDPAIGGRAARRIHMIDGAIADDQLVTPNTAQGLHAQ